jgi:hypothetical protein
MTKNTKITTEQAKDTVRLFFAHQFKRIKLENKLLKNDSLIDSSSLSDELTITTLLGLETDLKKTLELYVAQHPLSSWANSIYGLSPIVFAVLFSMININKAPTVGNIWSYCGLDIRRADPYDKTRAYSFNKLLKHTVWLIGQSFTTFAEHELCKYGHLYNERLEYETDMNTCYEYKELANSYLTKQLYRTESAKEWLETGRLHPEHIAERSRRHVVKIFLAHMHHVWYRAEFNTEPPKPFTNPDLHYSLFTSEGIIKDQTNTLDIVKKKY